jgi:glycosyltransferase involved in cell wall biosynthesis
VSDRPTEHRDVEEPLEVALDVTPLAGVPTGIAQSLRGLVGALGAAVDVLPYAISTRARLPGGDTHLPAGTRVVPGAGLLVWAWQRADRPRFDRFVRGAEVLHATNYLAPPTSLPTLVTIHDASIVRHRHLCSPAVRALEPVLRRALRRGADVHVPSQFVANEVRELFRADLRADARISVVPWGVPALPPPGDAALDGAGVEAPYVLAIGTLEPRKNLTHLVAAFGDVAATHPTLSLVLAGPDGPARPSIDDAIARLAVDARARVRVIGPVDDPTRAALLTRATVLAYPSIYEGFGLPVLEAMQCGTPVVAARAGAIPEVAGDGALLVDATDEAGIAAAIARVVDDPVLHADLAARGRARVERYSWDACASGIVAAYRSVLARQRADANDR